MRASVLTREASRLLAKLKVWRRKARESQPVKAPPARAAAPIAPPPEVEREIRLALVLNGGVSLAVWMGGVTHEIDELRRSSWQFPVEGLPSFSAAHGIYTGLLAALRTGLRVDIIAGSSAGGINGAALAAAIAVRRPLRVEGKPLRDLWVDVGDMTNLLRSAGEYNPPSLLKGDTFMLPQMRKAFASILGDGPAPLQTFSATAEADELQAALKAERADATAVRLFVTTTAFRPNSRPFTDALGTKFNVLDNRLRFRFIRDPWLKRDNFASTGSGLSPAHLMALAARATASFPVAFEPTLLDVTKLPAEILPLDSNTYAMDGGVLDNEPFDPALDQLSQMPADEDVARYLVYIVPYSNESTIPKDTGLAPTLRDVIGGVVNLPRDVGIDLDMDRITNLSVLARERETANLTLLKMTDDTALDALTAALGYQYETSPTRVAESEAPDQARLGSSGGEETVYQTFAPETPAAAEGVPASSEISFAAAERLALRAQAVLRDALAAAGDAAAAIKESRAVVSVAALRIRALSIEAGGAAAGGPALDGVVKMIVDRLTSTPGIPNPPEGWAKRLARVEVITQALPSSLARGIQPFEFVRLSADCTNALDIDLNTPGDKLAGLQLNHFGGFLKRSWRANDWTWGRLDGAARLIALLLTLEDARLVQAWESAKFAPALVELAFPADPGDFEHTLLALWNRKRAHDKQPTPAVASWAEARAAFEARLKPNQAIPAACIDAIVAHAQLRILTEEVPEIARQAKADKDNHWRQDTTAPGIPDDGSPLSPEHALAAFRDGWDGATETIRQEVSTPAFAKLAAQASVVGSSALAGSHAGIPGAVRSPLVWLRGATLGGFLFVRSWFAKPLAGLIFALLLIAAAVMTVLISSALAAFTVPVAVGVAVAGSALVLGGGSKFRRAAFTGVAVAAALVAVLLLVRHTGVVSYGTAIWIGLVAVCVVSGLVAGWACERLRPTLCLLLFLVGVLVAAGALICLRSSGPLLDWIADSAQKHWPIGLLSLAVSLPLVFGMRSLAAAVAPDPSG